ncbi:MAG TPA: hypothetical protein VI704_05725, partial [Bacteroidota bacterium]|nr:hypothetical protein [Bacteroidota bacterium]
MLGLQCIDPPLAPVAPTTDIQLTIPLFDRTRSVFDFSRKDTSALKRANDGSYYFETNQASAPVGIDTLRAVPRSSAQRVSVGKFGIDAIGAQSFSFSAGFPNTNVPNGITFPASSFRVDSVSMSVSGQFDYVAIDTGSLTLTVTNNLPLDISLPAPVVLKNNVISPPAQRDTATVASFGFGTILQGQSKTVSSNLSGRILRGDLKTDSIRVNTAARTGPFTLSSTDGISFTIGSTSLMADSASALIPSQTIASVNDSVMTIDDSVSIQQATFRSGAITAALINNLGVFVGISLKFDNLVDLSSGSAFLVQRTLPPKDSLILPINMANIRIDTTNASPPIGTNLRFSVGINTIT